MEELFSFYSNKVVQGKDEFKMFSKFFKEDRNYVEQWVDACMQKLHTKNDNTASELRCQGNEYYAKKQFHKSLELYTKALCNATYDSETYAVILANRSAVTYMMKNYKSCLKDIDICMNCKCPETVHLKVHIRKIKCCSKLMLQEQLNGAVVEALEFLQKCTEIIDKDKSRKDILLASLEEQPENELTSEFSEELPKPRDGFNSNFLYASSAVRISYDEQRGRRVVANKPLQPGDVLFVEKPFIFASIFANENRDLSFNKCYNCLTTVFSCVPCRSCTCCVFCDENCRDRCWNEFHKWECIGMQANLWYHIGIAFPALRALIKGATSGFRQLNDGYEADMVTYGNEDDNYGYFNKLVSNISKMKNVLPLIISAAVVTLYLKKQTNFFDWLMNQPNCSERVGEDLVLLVGGLLTRHIAQLQCNSSTISHKSMNWEDPCDSVPVACAIYPSISMMNHSCKPNITLHYVQDMALVQASEAIEANEEIFNCYGIDYRFDDWASRQEQCNKLYYFKCQCRVCKCSS